MSAALGASERARAALEKAMLLPGGSEHSKVEWEGTAAAAQLKAAPRADEAAVAAVAARLPRAADLDDEHPEWEQLCAPKFK